MWKLSLGADVPYDRKEYVIGPTLVLVQEHFANKFQNDLALTLKF
jgi:hypothetical protein